MLEEGQWLNNAWNTVKNGVKNAAAMYMDWRTNGQWNRKYNQHAKGSGYFVGAYYLDKWFKNHYNRLQDIIYGEYYGNRTYFYTQLNGRDLSFRHDWRSGTYTLTDNYYGYIYRLKVNEYNIPSILTIENYDGVKLAESTDITHNDKDNSYEATFQNNMTNLKIYSAEDESTPESYIAKNCTPNAFVISTKNTLENGKFKTAVVNYLQAIQKENKENMDKLKLDPNASIDYRHITSLFTMESFYSWYGKNYDASQQNNSQTQQQQQTQQQPKGNVNNTGQTQRDAANNSTQGKQSYFANADEVQSNENRRRRKAF
jgi:hypothetical protein